PEEAVLDDFTRINTELANMQRELARNNAELARANERLGLMLGMAAHDLRNPLGIIAAYAEYLQSRVEERLDPVERQFLQQIRDSSRFMTGIVESFLELSRTQLGRLVLHNQPLDLDVLVSEAVALNGVLAQPRRVRVRADRSGAGIVVADAPKLTQVLNNLIGNAVKFSPEGAEVRVSAWREGGEARVSVIDQGPGIPEAELVRLFQPFSRTSTQPADGSGIGTGLGLAISRTIVEGHGGRLTVDSVPGQGARFTMSLPV
ncbi:MAG: sensor histidine kinase, partial [Actinomycetota bacterium]